MTTRERTAAEIEAGARALLDRHVSEFGHAFPWIAAKSSWAWEVRQMVKTVLEAADAVAAPAVGVSKGNAGVLVSSLIDAVEDKRHNDVRDIAQRIIALLTAPEPGTGEE